MGIVIEFLVAVAAALLIFVVGVHLVPTAISILASALLQILPLVVVVWLVFAVLKAMVGQIMQ